MENYMEDWIGIEAAANYLDVTKDTIRNWIKKTDIPAHKIGKLWKFKRVELDAWVKSGRKEIMTCLDSQKVKSRWKQLKWWKNMVNLQWGN